MSTFVLVMDSADILQPDVKKTVDVSQKKWSLTKISKEFEKIFNS